MIPWPLTQLLHIDLFGVTATHPMIHSTTRGTVPPELTSPGIVHHPWPTYYLLLGNMEFRVPVDPLLLLEGKV